MAYVGTASNLGNDQNTLRSVVLGEAGGEGYTGELAVADVIQNRASGNYGSFPGASGGMVGVATAPNQFQGQANLSNYSDAQIAQADSAISAAQSGTDITGGATYYANPGASSASWATNLNPSNSLVIGNHDFTNNTQGIPFTGAGASTDTTQGSNFTNSQAVDPSLFPDSGVTTGGSTSMTGGYTLSAPYQTGDTTGYMTVLDAGGSGTSSTGNPYGSLTGANGGSLQPANIMGSTLTPNETDMLSNQTGGAPAPITPSSSSSSSSGSSSLTPANPAATPIAIATGANEQSQAATSAAQTTANATTAAAKALTGTSSGIFSGVVAGLTNAGVRIALVAAGLVLLLGAFWLMSSEEGQHALAKVGV